jgi:hypothetical protein
MQKWAMVNKSSLVFPSVLRGWGTGAEEVFDGGNVLGAVYATGVESGGEDADFEAEVEGAELFEVFGEFPRSGGALDEGEKSMGAVGVDANVAPRGLGGERPRGGVGNGGTGEVASLAGGKEEDFDDVGVKPIVLVRDGMGERGDVPWGLKSEVNEVIDFMGVDERFVTLDVDPEVGVKLTGDFGDAVGAGAVGWGGEEDLGTEGSGDLGDAIVVGGDDDGGLVSVLGDGFPDPLDHRFAEDWGKRFSRKACGGVAGGNDDEGLGIFHGKR